MWKIEKTPEEVWPPAHTGSTCRALTQPCPSASAMDWPQATEGQGCGGCPASAPSQAWPMALAHPCTPGYISTALQLGLSAQHCPHHGSLAHPGLGPVLLPRGSLGCDRKYRAWVCSLRMKVFSFCHLSLGLWGNCCCLSAPKGTCRTPAQAQLQWHLRAFHKGIDGKAGMWVCGNVGKQSNERESNGFSLLHGATCSWVWCTPREDL